MAIDLSIPLGASSEYSTLVARNRFRALFNSDAIGMAIARYDGTLVEVNAAFARMVGYTADELRNLGWRAITPEDQLAADEKAIHELETTGIAPTWEKDILHKDGFRVPILLGCARLPEGQVITYVLDNTGRKRAESALAAQTADLQQRIADSSAELRALASHLHTVTEEQSTTLAREIHDVLGQELTGLRLDTAWVARKLGDENPEVSARLVEMQARIDALHTTVRTIARDLRPKILDDLGLLPALEAHAQEWSARSEIAVAMTLPPDLDIDRERATAMFRIFQELLTNVVRHAGAKRVLVDLYTSVNGRDVCLDFDDDGCGMTTEATTSGPSLGLLGIRERLIAFGGELAISSSPGIGTHISIRLPLGVPGCES